MNLRGSFWILPVLALVAGPLPAGAQQPSGVYVTPYLGITFPLGSIGEEITFGDVTFPKGDLLAAPVVGANLGYRFGGGFAVEGMLVYSPGKVFWEFDTEVAPGVPFQLGFTMNTLFYGANLTYFFVGDKTAIVPFVTGGAGGVSFSTNIEDTDSSVGSYSDMFFDLGVGIDIPIREKIFLKYTLIDYFTSTKWNPVVGPNLQPEESSSIHYLTLLVGMTFYF